MTKVQRIMIDAGFTYPNRRTKQEQNGARSDYALQEGLLPTGKMQRPKVNCDGRVGKGGCTFCRTESFCPQYCHGTISEQLNSGKKFFEGKYPDMKYLAYSALLQYIRSTGSTSREIRRGT